MSLDLSLVNCGSRNRRSFGSGFRLRCGFDGRSPVAALRLDDQAHLDGLGRDFDPADLAVDHRPHLLDVGLELALGDAGGLDAYAAEILGFAAPGDAVARTRSPTGKMTHSRHKSPEFKRSRNLE